MPTKQDPSFISEREVATLEVELRLVRPYLLQSDLSGRCYFTEREREELLNEAVKNGFDYICVVGKGAVSGGYFSHSQLLNLNYYVRRNQESQK